MTKRILCPVDFSEQSVHALNYAGALAHWLGASVTTLYVHQMMWPIVGIGAYADPAGTPPLSEAERATVMAELTRCSQAAAAPGVSIESVVSEGVNVPATILAHATSMSADLIAIGTQGHSGFERLVLGSVAERVLRKASCPVVTVSPQTPPEALAVPTPARPVICAVDLSSSSPAALRWASTLAVKAGAGLLVVHVAELPLEAPAPPSPEWAAVRDRLVGAARERLDALTAEAAKPPRFDQRIVMGRPHDEILRLAGQEHAGLIVMGVRGRSAVDMTIFGSVTRQVVRRATCPVLTVHPDRA